MWRGRLCLQHDPRRPATVSLMEVAPMMTGSCTPLLQCRFMSVLPRIVRHARMVLRAEPWHQQEELLQEITAVCWMWFARLVQRGKDPTTFVSALAEYAARFVRSGRKLAGAESAHEVLSRWAQCR